MLIPFYFTNLTFTLNLTILSFFFFILISSLCVILIKDTIHAIFYFMFICIYMTQLCLLVQMEFLALNFIIIYLGAICVLILFQAKLVRLLTEKNSNIFINNHLFLPCLILFFILPLIQFSSIYYLLNDQFITNINLDNLNYNQIFDYNFWINDINSIDTLKIIG